MNVENLFPSHPIPRPVDFNRTMQEGVPVTVLSSDGPSLTFPPSQKPSPCAHCASCPSDQLMVLVE